MPIASCTGDPDLSVSTWSIIRRGGIGPDLLLGDALADALFGDAGDDSLHGMGGDDRLLGGDGNDLLDGGEGADSLAGGHGADSLEAGAGADSLRGDAGDDLLHGDAGDDILDGGSGNDTILAGAENDTVLAGGGHDRVLAGTGADVVLLGLGNDTAQGEAGADLIEGDAGADLLFGGEGADTLSGGAHGDRLVGGAGDDVLRGEEGLDWLWGGAGDDLLDGGDGVDRLTGGIGADTLLGGEGDDVLLSRSDSGEPDIAQGGMPVLADVALPLGDDVLVGGAGADLFRFELLVNARPEVAARHLTAEGRVDWRAVIGGSAAPHDHWIDMIGTDVVLDFSKAEGDRIQIVGYSVAVLHLHYGDADHDGIDDFTLIQLVSRQARGGAHDGDHLGTIGVFGDLLTMEDILLSGAVLGAYDRPEEGPYRLDDAGILPGGRMDPAVAAGLDMVA